MTMPTGPKMWRFAVFGIGLALIPAVALCEQFVLVCSLNAVNSEGDSLGHDRYTLHVDTVRGTVEGDPARIDKDYIRFSDPYVKGASTEIDRHSGRLRGVSGGRIASTGSCEKVAAGRG
jgi:hypothetical protein